MKSETPLRTEMRSGRHVMADFFGVPAARLRRKAELMRTLRRALLAGRFDIIRSSVGHQFEAGGQGVTGFFLLGQSHAAFHSYPEHGYLALDIYTCGSRDPGPVVEAMRGFLRPERTAVRAHRRGLKPERR